MKDLTQLLPKVQQMTNLFLSKCKEKGIEVTITSAYRSIEDQDALYAQGRTTQGNVVTNARGGDSFHNWKCAVDFAPVVNGSIPWNNKALFAKVGAIGKECGFEWGGDWASFLDLPHLQYTAGYTLQDFKNGKVDYTKFAVSCELSPFEKMMYAVRDFQVANGVLDFKNETNAKKIKLGPKTMQLITQNQL